MLFDPPAVLAETSKVKLDDVDLPPKLPRRRADGRALFSITLGVYADAAADLSDTKTTDIEMPIEL